MNSSADTYLRNRLDTLATNLAALIAQDPAPKTYDGELKTILDEMGRVRRALAENPIEDVDTREIFSVTLAAADTQYEIGNLISKTFVKAKAIYIHHLKVDADVRYAFADGLVAGPTEPYLIQPYGSIVEIERIIPSTIYYATGGTNVVLEVEILSIGGLDDV